MLYAILIIAFLAFLLGLLLYHANLLRSKKAEKLPSGKTVPSRGKLAEMKANQLVKEYSKADLRWLRSYALKQLPNTPFGAENIQKHMTWFDISRELDIALYGWTRL